MKQIFISYSRKDTEFARKIAARFQTEGLDIWIDWEDIPPSVDWMKQVQTGVEEADVVLFLASPDSINSKICIEEIAHAVTNGKRIIPIIVRDVEPKEVPTIISHLNWTFFSRPQDEFEESFKKTLTAIHTDYDWVEAHRQLQVKALDWERNKREDSFLLWGKELTDAQAQIMVNGKKDPHPTDLQRQYILKSAEVEKAEIERQRVKEQQLEMEQKLALRLRRLTYLMLSVFTMAYIVLFFWLNQVTGALAVTSIRNQMLALVETTVCFMYGDQFQPFVNTYSYDDKSAYTASYYKSLQDYMGNVQSMNENIATTDIVLYTIIKGSQADEYLVINSTRGGVKYKTKRTASNLNAAQIVGLTTTVADTSVITRNENGSWISACSPIVDSKGASVGALCADFNARLLDETQRRVISTLGIIFVAIYPAMIILVLFATRTAQKAKNLV